MSASAQAAELFFPQPVPPQPGELVDIAPGIRWLRLALPFALDHVNIYLIEDDGGWAVLDTGIADLRTRTVWERVRAEHRLTRLILTHYHPDHVGLAGWMTGELGLPVWMTADEHAHGLAARRILTEEGRAIQRAFYVAHGLQPAAIEAAMGRGTSYLKMTTGLPERVNPMQAGDVLRIGGRDFDVLTGGGHAPEQAMLLSRGDRVFLAADQILARISPNIGVWPTRPLEDPLAAYRGSLGALRRAVPDDVLAIPAHNLPFRGLHARIRTLENHHDARCNDVLAACDRPMTTAEILPVLFPRLLDAHQLGFAFGEVLAHVNHLVEQGALVRGTAPDGTIRVVRG